MIKKLLVTICLVALYAPATYGVVNVQEVTSPGGIKAWFVQDTKSQVISMHFAFRSGDVMDTKGKEGTADLAADMLTEGAGDLNHREFEAILQDLAIGLSFSADSDHFFGSVKTLEKHKDKAVELLHLALNKPRLDKSAMERIRSQHIAYLASIAQTPNHLISKKLKKILFKNHPYGRGANKSPKTVKTVAIADIKDYLRSNLAQDNLLVGVVGNLTVQEVGQLLDKVFGGLPQKATQPKIAEITAPEKASTAVIEKDIPQSAVIFAQSGWKADHPDYLKASILMHILGDSHVSRLNEEIRNKRGLAYHTRASLNPSQYTALVVGVIGTANDHVKDSIGLAKSEWRRMYDQGVTEKELADAKSFMTGAFPLQFTSSKAISGLLVGYQIAKRDISYFKKRNQLIEAITLSEVNDVAKRLLKPDALTFVIAGKPKDVIATASRR